MKYNPLAIALRVYDRENKELVAYIKMQRTIESPELTHIWLEIIRAFALSNHKIEIIDEHGPHECFEEEESG